MIVTKKVNKQNVQCLSYCLYTHQCQFQQNFCNNFVFQIITKGCKNDRGGLVPSPPPPPASSTQPVEEKKGQKQVKKKAFKIMKM